MADDNKIDFEPIDFEPIADVPVEQKNIYKADIPQDTSTLEGLGYGVQKGATLGFRDEIGAMAGALGAKSGGDERPFWDVYYDVLNTIREESKATEEQAPIATTAGEFMGGMIIPAGAMGQISKSAGALKKAGQAAKIGAKAGALYGLGMSEAKLGEGELGQAAKDVAGGAALGAATGAGLQLAGSGIVATAKGMGRFLKNQPFTRDVIRVFEKSKGGEELFGKVQEFSDSNRKLANELIDDLQNLRQMSGEFKEMGIDELKERGIKVDVKSIVDDIREKINKLDPIREEEQADILKLQKVLKNILKEEETTVTRFIPKAAKAKVTTATKAGETAAKKTAEAEVKDMIKIQELQDELQRLISEGADTDNIQAIVTRIRGLQSKTKLPSTIQDPVTGLPVIGVSRGVKKAPITTAITPEPEPLFTPIQKITQKKVTTGRSEVDPKKLDDILRSLSGYVIDRDWETKVLVLELLL